MDRSGDNLLARPGLAEDEHRGTRGRHLESEVLDVQHDLALTDKLGEHARGLHHFEEASVLPRELDPLQNLLDHHIEPVQVDRLGQEVVGSGLHRPDSVVYRPVCRQDQGLEFGMTRLQIRSLGAISRRSGSARCCAILREGTSPTWRFKTW